MNIKPVLGLFLLLNACTFPAHAKLIRLGVISDVNGSACQSKYPATSLTAFEQLLSNQSVDHIIMPGDAVAGQCMSYSGKTPYADVVKSMWEEFDSKFYQRAYREKNVRTILAPGNHDAPFLFPNSRETFKLENAEFKRHWLNLKAHLNVNILQVPGANDNYPYYWAYTYENILFIVLQSTRTHSLSDGDEQKHWLRAVLQSPEALASRAKIAFGHVPPYPVLDPSVGGKFSEIIEKEQVGSPNGLVDLLLDKNVDLLITGHSHAPYPAELTRKSDKKKIKILSMPCGHAPRKLRSKQEAAPRGYALVEVNEDNKISVSVRNWSDSKAIPADYFPKSIPLNDSKVTYDRMNEIY